MRLHFFGRQAHLPHRSIRWATFFTRQGEPQQSRLTRTKPTTIMRVFVNAGRDSTGSQWRSMYQWPGLPEIGFIIRSRRLSRLTVRPDNPDILERCERLLSIVTGWISLCKGSILQRPLLLLPLMISTSEESILGLSTRYLADFITILTRFAIQVALVPPIRRMRIKLFMILLLALPQSTILHRLNSSLCVPA